MPKRESFFAKLREPISIFTALLVLVGFVQGWSFIESERAYLNVENLKFKDGRPVAGARPLVIFEIRNSGRTTATIENLIVNGTDNLAERPNYSGAGIAAVPVPAEGKLPNVADPIRAGGKSTILTADQAKAITSGQTQFYVYGFVEYSDAFSLILGNMRTGFCFVYDPKDLGAGVFGACPQRAYTYAYRHWAGRWWDAGIGSSPALSQPTVSSTPVTLGH